MLRVALPSLVTWSYALNRICQQTCQLASYSSRGDQVKPRKVNVWSSATFDHPNHIPGGYIRALVP